MIKEDISPFGARGANKVVIKSAFSVAIVLLSIFFYSYFRHEYHEPTDIEIQSSLKLFYPTEFEVIITDVKNMGVWVRQHQLVITSINSISQNPVNNDSCYCYKWDSAANSLDFILSGASMDCDGRVFVGYKLTKQKNSNIVKAYDDKGDFVKEFVLFQ